MLGGPWEADSEKELHIQRVGWGALRNSTCLGRGCDQDQARGETGLWCSHNQVSGDPEDGSGAERTVRAAWVRRMELDLRRISDAPGKGMALPEMTLPTEAILEDVGDGQPWGA